MKRKIVIGLGVFVVVFLLGGLYIARTISTGTADLDRLITLHQVEILREQFLLQLKKVQLDLALKGTHSSRSPEVVVADVKNMGKRVDTCFQCHHAQRVTDELQALKGQTARYEEAVRRALSSPADASGVDAHEEPAIHIGEELTAQVREMIDVTSARLGAHTMKTLDAIARTRYVIYAMVALGPVLAAILGFVFISGLTRPVNVLLESTRTLKGGDLDHRVADLSDEFRELALAFNDMASSLKEQMQRAQRTEQMVVVGQLAAGLAHEIKNPLGGIKAAMQVLYEEADLSKDDRDVVKRVSREVGRLEALMKNFLNFAKPAKPQLTELNVNDLVNTILASSSPGRPASVAVTKELQPLPETMADPAQLHQILLNLLLNAVDSMPNGGTLGVRTFFDQGAISIEIADTGRGVSPEHVDKIFMPFFTTKPKGTGLGLAISKQLVEQHGGSITVATRPTGGSVFRVQLPWQRPRPVAA